MRANSVIALSNVFAYMDSSYFASVSREQVIERVRIFGL